MEQRSGWCLCLPRSSVEGKRNHNSTIARKHNASYVKHAAALSLALAPNDVWRSHRLMKQFVSKLLKKHMHQRGTAPFTKAVDELLQGRSVSSASKNTFVWFISWVVDILLAGYGDRSANVEAWRKSGMYPFDMVQILNQCASWKDVHPDDAKRILAKPPSLVSEARLPGYVSEEALRRHLGDLLDDAGRPKHSIAKDALLSDDDFLDSPRQKRGLNDRPLNHQRTWIAGDGVLALRNRKEELKQKRLAQKLQDRLAKQRQKAEAEQQKAAEKEAKAEERRREAEERRAEADRKRQEREEARRMKEEELLKKREEKDAARKRKEEERLQRQSGKKRRVWRCANPECSKVLGEAGDESRGCDSCDLWFCIEKRCQRMLFVHEKNKVCS